MIKTFFLFASLILAALPAISQTSVHFQPLTAEGCSGKGVVYPTNYGDTIEWLMGPNWRLAIPDNPGISDRIYVDSKGRTIVMLYPGRGDTLCIPYWVQTGEWVVILPTESNSLPEAQEEETEAVGIEPTYPNSYRWDCSFLGFMFFLLFLLGEVLLNRRSRG
jgi:hypothetical protein